MLKTLYFGLSVLTGGDVFAEGIQQPESDAVEQRSEVLPTVTGSQPSQILEAANPRALKFPKDVEVVNRLLSVTSTLVVCFYIYEIFGGLPEAGRWLYQLVNGFERRASPLDRFAELRSRHHQEDAQSPHVPANADEGTRFAYLQQEMARNNTQLSEHQQTWAEITKSLAEDNARRGREWRCWLNQIIVLSTVAFDHPALRVLAVASHLYTLRDQWEQSWFRVSLNSIHLSATVYRDLRLWWHKRHNRG
jgi:hypothetical protein